MEEFGKKVINLYNSLVDIGENMNSEISYRIKVTPNFQQSGPVVFGGFPWYYRLVTRGSGIYVSKEGSFFFSVAPSWNTEKNTFLDDKYIIIRPEVHANSISDFIDFSKLLSKSLNTPIVLKQVTKHLFHTLLEYGFRSYSESECWDQYSKFDDQTYPEIVLRTDHYVSANYARGSIKDQVNANEYYIEESDLSKIDQRESVKEEIFRVFYDWLRVFLKRFPNAINKNFVSWNLLTFDAMISDELMTLLSIKNKTGKTIGIFSLIKTSSYQFDVVFSFISEFAGNFQRVAYDMLISWIQKNYNQCIYLNLGGSELKSLYEFKKSIGSCEELETYHLVLS